MCAVYNPICDVQKFVGAVGENVAGSVFDAVAKDFSSAADKVTQWMWTVIGETTKVDLSGGWFHSTLGITSTLAGLIIAALFVLELIEGVVRREPASLGRAAVGVGAGILGAAASIGVVSALLSATDALSDGIVQTTGAEGIDHLGAEIAPTAALTTIESPALMLILSLGYILASFFVWAMFVMRKAMLIVAAVFAPVAFAGAPMRATGSWVRRWIEITVALIFSKLVVVILFTLAISLVGSPGEGFAAVGALFSGLAMLVIACFAPWMLFKLVHFVGGDVMQAHHQGMTAATLQAGSTPVSMARTGAARVAGIVGGASAGASGGGAVGGGAASGSAASTAVGSGSTARRQTAASTAAPSTTTESGRHDGASPALAPPSRGAAGVSQHRADAAHDAPERDSQRAELPRVIAR